MGAGGVLNFDLFKHQINIVVFGVDFYLAGTAESKIKVFFNVKLIFNYVQPVNKEEIRPKKREDIVKYRFREMFTKK